MIDVNRENGGAVAAGSSSRDIIVVGASAGGLEALIGIIAGLPAELPAAVLVVLHTAPSGPGLLPKILQRASALPVAHGIDGQPVERGRVYVARPDHHLLVADGKIRVTRGPKENHTRPALDPLFRSAALEYGPRVVGVVLTGVLDDGTAGLHAIKQRGGTAVVQDPDEALFPDMPRNAMRRVAVDHVVRLHALPSLLIRLGSEPAGPIGVTSVSRETEIEIEARIAREENALAAGVMQLGPASPYTCPDCHGVLLELGGGPMPRFRCHTGHAFSLDGLLATLTTSVEESLWNGLRAVEESVMLLRHMSRHALEGGEAETAAALEQKATEAVARGELVRRAALLQEVVSREAVASTSDHGGGAPRGG
jgi:two-component system chemotaxis response regulator CheB